MDNFQGDLTDIVRASAGAATVSGDPDWQFPSEPMSVDTFQPPAPLDGFGNPFSNMRDPLLHFPPPATASSFYVPNSPSSNEIISPSATGALLPDSPTTGRFVGVGGHVSNILGPKMTDEERMKPPCSNRFSQMLQISTAAVLASPTGVKTGDIINGNSSNSSGQISSPRNPGIKRRKSQAKKVVCIPAPASAGSRATGEVVPSDLWAWRKYGQKPIKGSPYPRGYYRCSSSKGCSARKQVERSRTDPNMLVITYTSEHNHPWPTQRNALAGSTRSQPAASKTSTCSSSASKTSLPHKTETATKEEEQKEDDNMGISSSTVKEEKQFDNDGVSYRPAMPTAQGLMSEQDTFFADLDEIEADPLHLLFTQAFSTDQPNNKGLDEHDHDHFTLFDWPEDNNKGL